jgi:chromosome segregation ATPase
MFVAAAEFPAYVTWVLPILIVGILVQFFWNSIISVGLYRMSKADRNVEKLELNLHTLTEKLIDERMRRISHDLDNHVQGMVSTIDEVKDRLTQRDGALQSLGEKDHKIELEVLSRLSEIKQFVVERAASKDDLKEHERSMQTKVDRIEGQITRTNERLTGIEKNTRTT